MSYLTVFALTIGTLIAFGLATALTTQTVESTYDDQTYSYQEARPDRTWPLLAPNPFVILADAAPRLPAPRSADGMVLPRPLDPLGDLGDAVREARRRPGVLASGRPRPDGGPVWPYGLAFDVLLAGGAVAVTIRRLRTPVRRLPRGVRIA